MKKFILSLLSTTIILTSSCLGFGEETVRRALLYCVCETEDGATILFDGYRNARFSDKTTITDATGGEIDSLLELSQEIGREPDLEKAKIGDWIGEELGDAFYADLTLEGDTLLSVAIIERASRPWIGTSWTNEKGVSWAQRVQASAIFRNGGRVVFLTKSTTEEDSAKSLEGLDGFVMPGGYNLDPAHYGETPYPHGSVSIDPVRDLSDILVTRQVIEKNIPGLWICRGEQVLNVALGGGLIQDVPTYLGVQTQNGAIDESEVEIIPDDGAPTTFDGKEKIPCMPLHYRVTAYGVTHSPSSRHSLGTKEAPGISENSRWLRSILGARYYPSVLSWHHQAVDPNRLGKGLTVVATAPDGIVEGIEYQGNDFALGVQFHPDYDSTDKDIETMRYSNLFFRALIEAARH